MPVEAGAERLHAGIQPRACPFAEHQPGAPRAVVEADDRVVKPDHHVGHVQAVAMARGKMFQRTAQLIPEKPDGAAAERQGRRNGHAVPGGQFAAEQAERIAGMRHAVDRDDTLAEVQNAERIEADIACAAAGIPLRRTVEKDEIWLAGQGGEAIFRPAPGYFLDVEGNGAALRGWI